MDSPDVSFLTMFLVLLVLPLVITVQYFIGMVTLSRLGTPDLSSKYGNYFRTWLVGVAVLAAICAVLWVLYSMFVPRAPTY